MHKPFGKTANKGIHSKFILRGELSEWSKVQHSKCCVHFGSPNCRKASNHAGLRASSNRELGSVLSCCSSRFPRLEFCGKMAIMRTAIWRRLWAVRFEVPQLPLSSLIFRHHPSWSHDSKSGRRRKACGGSNPSISAKRTRTFLWMSWFFFYNVFWK